MKKIESSGDSWRIRAGGLELDLAKASGVTAAITMKGKKDFDWAGPMGDVFVRDDRLRKTFGRHDPQRLTYHLHGDTLVVERRFRDAPWIMRERYSVEKDALRWEAEVSLPKGDFRSCAIGFRLPLPLPIYPLNVWTATERMPTQVARHAELTMEYGNLNSGTFLPVVSIYSAKPDAGLLMAMPFDFQTPLLRFRTSYRGEYVEAVFDWMALKPGRPARACLLLRATPGHWRPALGWLFERFKEYFIPRSSLIHELWGGHFGTTDRSITLKQAKLAASLGVRSYELHEHFAGYGDYVPDTEPWRTCHNTTTPPITTEIVRDYIARVQAAGIKALPYFQVSGDGDVNTIAKWFAESQMRDLRGKLFSSWPATWMMNSDLSLPFGRFIERAIDEMMRRYPNLDGIWLDQACYNFLDTAHDDGLTAVDNKPCYIGGLNYQPHLEHLSSLLHPKKAIISNGPFGIGIMKYIDGIFIEGHKWFGEKYQYYCLEKPIYFAHLNASDRDTEFMLQGCLLFGAGQTACYPEYRLIPDLYKRYIPLLNRMHRRHWVFDSDPFALPVGYEGNLYRSERNTLLLSAIPTMACSPGRRVPDMSARVKTADSDAVRQVTCQEPGGPIRKIPFKRGKNGVEFNVPARAAAALFELR